MRHFCFAGSRLAMLRLARAQPGIAVLSFDRRCATPVLPGRDWPTRCFPSRSLPKQAFNATRQQTASTEIPIASDPPPRHTSRGFLPWRFAYAGPRRAPRHLHGAAIRKPSQKQTHALQQAGAIRSPGRLAPIWRWASFECRGLGFRVTIRCSWDNSPRPSTGEKLSF